MDLLQNIHGIDEDIDYIDDDQIKVKLDNVVTTDFTVDRTGGIT